MASNLTVRTFSGVAMTVILVACSLHLVTYALMMVLGLSQMMNEYYIMSIGKRKCLIARYIATACASLAFLAILGAEASLISTKLLFAIIFAPLAIFLAMLFNNDEVNGNRNSEKIAFPLLYIAVPVCATSLLMFDASGLFSPIIFLYLFALTCMNDIGAYLLGMALGQRPTSLKLYPKVSPHKSWWGIVGGILFTIAAAIGIFFAHIVPITLAHHLALALIVVIFGTLGDLFESLQKRHYGVKDAGNFMPGHGGLLDRFDAALFVMPVAVIYLKVFQII